MTYEAPHRDIDARIYTSAGWIKGSFRLPQLHGLIDHLDHSGPFLRLAGVVVPGLEKPCAAMALRRNAAIVILPMGDEDELQLRTTVADTVGHRVSCILHAGVVSGVLASLRHVNPTDFLIHHPGFILLRDCHIFVRGERERGGPFPLVIVNAARVVAVSGEPMEK
ncbi:MAG: hypothetical protein U0166_09265 [Acidobacteriota bacterium]